MTTLEAISHYRLNVFWYNNTVEIDHPTFILARSEFIKGNPDKALEDCVKRCVECLGKHND